MIGSWGKSSSSASGDRDCLGGCSRTAGGWRRRRARRSVIAFPKRDAPRPGRIQPRVRHLTLVTSREMKTMSIATASDFEIAARAPAGRAAGARRRLRRAGRLAVLRLGRRHLAGAVSRRARHRRRRRQPRRAPRRVQIAMAAIFVAGLLALIEEVNALSVTVAALATALFVIVVTARASLVLAMATARCRDDPVSRSISTGR